jgi:L-threonylcarbamoyladenylate synthase
MPTNDIDAAVSALLAGRLVAIPTETVYGLAADATNTAAVASIFAAKHRPRFNPLICHVASAADAASFAILNDTAKQLTDAFWPGALTLVLPLRTDANISDLVTAGLDTVAVRVPAHPVALQVLQAVGRPLAAPSANRSGRVSPTTLEHVQFEFTPDVAMGLDGGPSQLGLESTIVDATQDRVRMLRLGSVTREAIEESLGEPLALVEPGKQPIQAPGQLQSHYAPSAQLRLNVRHPKPHEALLAFGCEVPAHAGPMANLSEAGDVTEAARNLFSALRTLDTTGASTIAVMPIPEKGLGEAINDRLRRAAAPRP